MTGKRIGRATALRPGVAASGRAIFDRLEAANARSARGPRRALAVAAALGVARHALSGRWPAAGEVAELFGTDASAARRIARRIAGREARNRLVLSRIANRPLAPFAELVRWRDRDAAAALGPGVILLTAHVGAIHLQGAALDAIGLRRTVVRWSPVHLQGPGESNALVHGGLAARTAALRSAVAALEAGGSVVTTLDGGFGASTPERVLGRVFGVGSGPFLMARQSGARLVPFATSWLGNEAVCELGEPIATAAEAARWLERFLRADPAQASLGLLGQLLLHPVDDPAVENAPGLDSAAREKAAELQVL